MGHGGSWAQRLWGWGQPAGDLSLRSGEGAAQGRCCHLQDLVGMETQVLESPALRGQRRVEQNKHLVAGTLAD